MALIDDSTIYAHKNVDPVALMGAFYGNLVQIKRWIEQGKINDKVMEQLKLSRAPTTEETAEAISLRLQHWLEQARRHAAKVLTNRECARIDEALYVMASLADELFLIELKWDGKNHWRTVLLEEKIFGTCYSGEQLFVMANRLINTRVLDAQQQKLISVYLLVLRLGFSGRYRNQPDHIYHFRQELFKRISVSTSDDTRICSQAYQHILVSREEKRLAPLAGWYRMMVIGAGLYLLLSLGIWIWLKGNWENPASAPCKPPESCAGLAHKGDMYSVVKPYARFGLSAYKG